MNSMRAALNDATAQLAEISDTPRLDAELLMALAIGVTREALLLEGLEGNVPPSFASFLARRMAHEPLAYILGVKDFWSFELQVSPAVLIPRPDSETLIEAARAYFTTHHPRTILDLGTGSGALLAAALVEFPHARGLGVDASDAALAVAAENAARLGLASRADFKQGDWGEGLSDRYDLILCNPPYIETAARLAPDVIDFEPHSALFAGADGLADYRRIIPQLAYLLAAEGVAVLEIGHTQRASVSALAHAKGFHVDCRKDLAGHDRCLTLTQPIL